MTPVETLLAKLRGAKKSGNGWSARCPAHDDRRASLSVAEGTAGTALVKCHAGCDTSAILAAIGMTPADLFPARTGSTPARNGEPASGGRTFGGRTFATASEAVAELERTHGKRSALWTYHDAQGEPVGAVVRWDKASGKYIRPLARHTDGWHIGAMPAPRALYGLPKLAATELVIVTEGEKTADAARRLGFAATTSAGGANAASKTDWGPLADKKIIILPDSDPAGERYAGDVARLAHAAGAASVRILRLADHAPQLPTGGDLADVLADERWCGLPLSDAAGLSDVAALIERLAAAGEPWRPGEADAPGPILIRLADVEPRPVSWLWPGRIPLGRITLLVGRPGEGKSFLTTDVASRVTTGTTWPDGSVCPKGSVIIISAEGDPADTIRPRLDAHCADVDKVHLLSAVRRVDGKGQSEHMVTLAELDAIEESLARLPDCKLIIVDPIGSFLGGRTDAHRDNEVRSVLAPVAKLAADNGPAVLVVAHRRKSAGSIADDLALGSRAFTGIARAVWHLTRDQENKSRRLMLPGKNNLAAEGDGLAFTIIGEPARISWERDPVPMRADDALAAEQEKRDAKRGPKAETRNRATEWLRELLQAGPMPAKKVKEEATSAGYSWRTVHRAKDELDVKPVRREFAGGWIWELPSDLACQDHVKQQNNLASWHDSKNREKNGASELGTIGTCQDAPSWHDSGDSLPSCNEPASLFGDSPPGRPYREGL
jgi:hypothetical protein